MSKQALTTEKNAENSENIAKISVPVTPMEIMQRALESGIDADQLEKLLELQERWEAGQARKAFAAAISEFQARCPTVLKSAQADRYTYAPLDEILRTIRPHLSATGLSVRFSTELTANNVITATCFLSHKDGHTESSQFAAPVDPQMRVNETQKVGSANSYAKRYALLNALNLVASDREDDDGAAAGTPLLTERQVAQLVEYVDAYQLDEAKLLRWLNVDAFEDVPAAKWPAIEHAIQRKIELAEQQEAGS